MDYDSPLREAHRIMAESIKSIPTQWVVVVATGITITFLATFFNKKFDLVDEHSAALAKIITTQDEAAKQHEEDMRQIADSSKAFQTQFESLQNQIELLSQRFPAIDNHIATMSKDTQRLYELVGDIREIKETIILYGSRLGSLEDAKDLKWLAERVEELRKLMDRVTDRLYKIEIDMFQRQGPPSPKQHTFPLETPQPPHQRMD